MVFEEERIGEEWRGISQCILFVHCCITHYSKTQQHKQHTSQNCCMSEIQVCLSRITQLRVSQKSGIKCQPGTHSSRVSLKEYMLPSSLIGCWQGLVLRDFRTRNSIPHWLLVRDHLQFLATLASLYETGFCRVSK